MKKLNRTNAVLIVIFLFSTLGTVIFFPVKYDSGKTCLFHRVFGGDEENLPNHTPYVDRAHDMLHKYISSYAVLWWMSLGIIAICIYLLKQNKGDKNIRSEHGN